MYILTLHPAKTSYRTLFPLWLLFSPLPLDNANVAVFFFILNTRLFKINLFNSFQQRSKFTVK